MNRSNRSTMAPFRTLAACALLAVIAGGTARAANHDFDGDGNADLLWRNFVTNEVYLYRMNGSTILPGSGPVTTVTADWQIVGLGDFNGGGTTDILWQNSATGLVYMYFMNGASVAASSPVVTVAPGWQVAGVEDFDADEDADILWRNSDTGLVYLYQMSGATITAATPVATVALDWDIAGVGDFDADNNADILWFNRTSGAVYLYRMGGANVLSFDPITTVTLDWEIAGIGDFDSNGRSDILWKNANSGLVYLYSMDGATILSAEPVTTVAEGWVVADIGDYNGDNEADIMWRHNSSGLIYNYTMGGNLILSSAPVVTVLPEWQIGTHRPAAPPDLDADDDGIPDAEDAFDNDPNRFANYLAVALPGVDGATLSAAVHVNEGHEIAGWSAGVASATALSWNVAAPQAPAFQHLPLATPAGNVYSAAFGIGDAEAHVVGESQEGTTTVAVIWPNRGAQATKLPIGAFVAPSAALAIAGERIVGQARAVVNGPDVALLWSSPAAAPLALGTLAGGDTSRAYAISDDGQYVVGEGTNGTGAFRGVVWTLSAAGAVTNVTSLEPLVGDVSSSAFSVNDGVIAGESESATGVTRAVRWTIGGSGTISTPLALGNGAANAVHGQRVVGRAAGQGALWDLRNLGLLESLGVTTASQGIDINGSGEVTGLEEVPSVPASSPKQYRAFLAIPQ